MPDIDFTIDTSTGEFQMHVRGIAGPACDEIITLPEDVKPGDTVRCCGQTYRLTFEFGAFAAEA